MRRALILALLIAGPVAAQTITGGSITGGSAGASGGGGGGALAATFTGPCNVVANANADETDECFCTRVRGQSDAGTGDALYRSDLIRCEDGDPAQLWDEVNHADWVGDGAPFYGPPYDAIGGQYRGENSYWHRIHGNVVVPCQWGSLASPTYGKACGNGQPGPNCGPQAFDGGGGNPWNAGSNTCLGFLEQGDGGIVDSGPTNGLSTAGDVFAGNGSIEMIQFDGTPAGTLAEWGFGATAELGITYVQRWSANYITAGSLGGPVKGHEMGVGSHQSDIEYLIGYQSNSSTAFWPFTGFVWTRTNTSGLAAIAGASASVGSFALVEDGSGNDVAVRFWASGWTRPGDWLGRWICLKEHRTGFGTSNVSVAVYEGDTLRYEVSGIDGAEIKNDTALTFGTLNIYHNNAGSMSADVSIMLDNFVLVAGPPMDCADVAPGL